MKKHYVAKVLLTIWGIFLHENNRNYNFSSLSQKFALSSFPTNVRLDEDVLKVSFVFIFRRRLQDVLFKTNIFALVIHLQRTFSRSLQDVLVKTNIFVLVIRLHDVFKMFSRCLQNVFKTFSRCLAKTSSGRFQEVSPS